MWELIDGIAHKIDGLPVADRGFLLGDGVFETFRIDDKGIRFGDMHAVSLKTSCVALDLPMPDWLDACTAFGRLKPARNCVGKIMVTRGAGARGLAPIDAGASRIFLSIHDYQAPAASFSLQTVSVRRSAFSLAARFKTMSYADNLAARREAVAAGADMALILTEDGVLSGADCASLFWISGDRVCWPSNDCAVRDGVTRAIVQKALERDVSDYAPHAGRFAPDVLVQAEAVFIGNAVIGIRPVHAIDGRDLPTRHNLLTRLQAVTPD